MNNAPLSAIKSYLDGNKRFSVQEISKFATGLVSNPSHHLAWADVQFNNAARLEVAKDMLDLISYGEERGEDELAIRHEVIRICRHNFLFRATQATNTCSAASENHLNQARIEEWAKLYEWLVSN